MRIDDNLHGMTVRKTNMLFLFSVKCPVFSEEVIIERKPNCELLTVNCELRIANYQSSSKTSRFSSYFLNYQPFKYFKTSYKTSCKTSHSE